VVALGQNALDRVARIVAVPDPGGKCEALEVDERPGGQVATAALACARLGLRVVYVGAVGDDTAGERAIAPLAEAGVDVRSVRKVPGAATQGAMIWVDARGERTLVWHRDPRLALDARDLAALPIESARLLLLDAGDPEVALSAATRARGAGVASLLDADSAGPGVAELARRVDFPVLSEPLALALGDGDLAAGLADLSAGRSRMAVATLGARGAIARRGDETLTSPAFPVDVVDTTGAGDAFHAGLAWAVLAGEGASASLRAANAVAALACRGTGAQGSLPSPEEVAGLMRRL
jgi:sugar/nucleoside kinase (ribokinase family)